MYLLIMEKAAEPSASGAAQGGDPKGEEHIPLVDDELPIVRLRRQNLERLGYRVTTRYSSREALEAFKASPSRFDLGIKDMTMPHMTGAQLAEAMLAVRPDIPIVVCTGFSERIDREKAAALGIKGFLMKPIVKSDMVRMIRKVLEGRGEPHGVVEN